MENLADDKEPESIPQQPEMSTGDKELTEAVERVYRRYGSDLCAFVRDVQRDVQKVHRSSGAEHRVVRIGD
jgi:hypothetical protein